MTRRRRVDAVSSVVAGVLAGGFAAVVLRLIGRPWDEVLLGAGGMACALAVAGLVTDVLTVRWTERRKRDGVVESAMRVVSGEVPGLRRHWQPGAAHLSHGSIRFVPLAGGWRVLRRAPVDLAVTAVTATGTRTGPADMWRTTSGLPILDVTTADATLRWAVPAAEVEWVQAQLRGPVSAPGQDHTG